MKKSFAKKHPQVVRALNRLAGKITEAEMQDELSSERPKTFRPTGGHDYLVSKGF